MSDAAPAIAYTDVSYAYPGGDDQRGHALDHITFTVRSGERLGILGPNGGGKSTLVKLTLGLLDPQRGDVRVLGHDPAIARAKGLIGYVPQKIECETTFPLSVRQVIEMPAMLSTAPWSGVPRETASYLDSLLELVGITDLRERPIGALSGGQLQRVMIARALASRPKLLLLDEPTVGIDVAGQQLFGEMLKRVHAELGLTLVLVSHDIRVIANSCDRVACLARTLHFHDAPSGLTAQVLADVFRHDMLAAFGDVHVLAHDAKACTHDHSKDGRG